MLSTIKWNNRVKLILSDVDETVADLYVNATPEMISELTQLLEEGKVLFFVTGQGLESVQRRIIDFLPQKLRKNILIGHCSGVEVWGHDEQGNRRAKPFYSVYEETLTEDQKKTWRQLVAQVVQEFEFKTFPTMPVKEFVEKYGDDPLTVMLEDRGPQITFEVVNGYDLSVQQAQQLSIDVPETHGAYDIRIPLVERADQLFQAANLPITSRLGGTFAVDFAVKGVSKTTAVKYAMENPAILATVGLQSSDLQDSNTIEIWGDKFSRLRGGTDRHMSEAVSKEVRSIDFRQELPDEFEPGYNIVVWDGERNLHEGSLEYLQSRHK
jgi:hydroxymethylpyrimidine pyrophosphatase-like HAD family hydrolase